MSVHPTSMQQLPPFRHPGTCDQVSFDMLTTANVTNCTLQVIVDKKYENLANMLFIQHMGVQTRRFIETSCIHYWLPLKRDNELIHHPNIYHVI